MTMSGTYFSMALAMLACVMLYTVCWVPYSIVLEKNPCEMTFTNKQLNDRRKAIPLKGSNLTSFKLWRYVNDYEFDWLDEPQPVLFIPGHQGSADQVRSLASDIMHNKDGPFQYFSIDFGTAWSGSSAIHANNVVAQAIFVNEALTYIQNRYISRQKKSSRGKRTTVDGRPGGGDPPQVTVVAHSAGGIVARLAVLLSNHPARKFSNATTMSSDFPSSTASSLDLTADGAASVVVSEQENNSKQSPCLVSTILLFSSPISKPEFCLDVSLSKLYNNVNQAWLSSYFHSSKQCLAANARRQGQEKRHALASAVVSKASGIEGISGIDVDWVCPRCVANIQVVSITGGLLDRVVTPLNTHVSVITPQPTQLSAEKAPEQAVAKGETMITLLLTPHKLVWYLLKQLGGQMLSVPSRIIGMLSSPSNQTDSLAAAAIASATTAAEASATVNTELEAEVCTVAVETDVDGTEVSVSTCRAEIKRKGETGDKVDGEFQTTEAKADNADVNVSATSSVVVEPQDESESALLEYIEPQHISMWASQLMWSGQEPEAYLGYPVDHAAQLWCYQLLNSVHEGLVEIMMTNRGYRHSAAVADAKTGASVSISTNSTSANVTSINMASFFNIFVLDGNETSRYVAEKFPKGQRAAHAARNRMYTTLWRDGFAQDMQYINSLVQIHMPLPFLSSLYVLGITYLTKHCVPSILFCFALISLSVFLVPLFRNICGIITTSSSSEFIARSSAAVHSTHNHGVLVLVRPWVHFQLDILAPSLYHVLYPDEASRGNDSGSGSSAGKGGKGKSQPSPFTVPSSASRESRITRATTWVNRWVGILLVVVVVRVVYHYQTYSLGKFVAAYEHPFKWFVSYGVAMMIYYVLSLVLNALRVVVSCLVVIPVSFVADWLCLRPIGFMGRLLLFNTVWKVKAVRLFIKKNFGIRREEKKAPAKKEAFDPAAEAARRRAGLPKSTGGVFVSEEEEEDKTLAAAEAAARAVPPSLARLTWVLMGPVLFSAGLFAGIVGLALVHVDAAGQIGLSLRPVQQLTTGHFVLTALSMWLRLLLMANYLNILFGSCTAAVSNTPSGSSFMGRLRAMRLDDHESQILLLYSVVLVLAVPHMLQSAELLYGTSSVSSTSPQLLTWFLHKFNGTQGVYTHSLVTYIMDTTSVFMSVVDSNRTLKTASLVSTGHALYGPERIYDLCCLAICNCHLLALMYWRKISAQTGVNALSGYGFVGQTEGGIANVALSWCVSAFGFNHPNFSPQALLAGGVASVKLNDPAQMYGASFFNSVNGNSSSSNSTCCHEDGGKFAVFEEVTCCTETESNIKMSSRAGGGMCLSSTKFKVIFCACSRDKSLTNGVIDYCEYCRCYKCGGKNLPRDDMHASNDPAAQAKEALRTLVTKYFNVELLLLSLCVAVVVWAARSYGATNGLQTNFFLYSYIVSAFSGFFMLYLVVRSYAAKFAVLLDKF